MTTARAQLLAEKRISIREARTHGGHEVGVLHLTDTKGIATAIDRAASHKRGLQATLNSWVAPRSGYRLGLIGEAGERVAHNSLIEAAPHGLRLERPEGGEVRRLLGEDVEGGPLDSACWVQVTNEVGASVGVVLCPIEVKNIRHWIYPNARELHQLLHKAALLQKRHEDVDICPILITRKKSFSANEMSRELGFRVLDVHKQFVLPVAEVDRQALVRIQEELGFKDLVAQDAAHAGLVSALKNVATTALPNAHRWREFGPELIDHFDALREDLGPKAQAEAMQSLREAVLELGGEARW